jgi:hypothetical protein
VDAIAHLPDSAPVVFPSLYWNVAFVSWLCPEPTYIEADGVAIKGDQ